MRKVKLFGYVALALVALSLVLSIWTGTIHAAPVSQQEPLVECEVFANPGNIKIFRCVDPETDAVIYQNQMGFMFVKEW